MLLEPIDKTKVSQAIEGPEQSAAAAEITPVLLCGGNGMRLWPLSRKSYPKQFVPLIGQESLFQAAARSVSGPGWAPPVIITTAGNRFIVGDQLGAIGIAPGPILVEPDARNTAAAALAAALHIERSDPDAILLLLPTGQVIRDPSGLRTVVDAGLPAAREGKIVAFGLHPNGPRAGGAWLGLASIPDGPHPVRLRRFVGAADATRARELMAMRNYLWNAGPVLATARSLCAAFERSAPELVSAVRASVDGLKPDLGFLRLGPEEWADAPDATLESTILAREEDVVVVPSDMTASEFGDWSDVRAAMAQDDDGNALAGPVTAVDCEGSLLRSESEDLQLVALGLRNIVAVAMPDAVLIADASRTGEIDRAVAMLKAKKVRQAETAPRDHRPWGWFESLALGDRFQVKRIVVHPGGSLSLQSHVHRAEHWIVVQGTARVTIDESVSLLTENQSVYIPLGSIHRLENPGKLPVVLIEVQTGCYLGEDDIRRYEDVYAREQAPT